MKIDPQRVLAEIEKLKKDLEIRLKNQEDFPDVHKAVLRLCREIFHTKKEYKIVDVPYPSSPIQIVLQDGTEINRVSIEKDTWKQKRELGAKILAILEEAQEVFSLKSRILTG